MEHHTYCRIQPYVTWIFPLTSEKVGLCPFDDPSCDFWVPWDCGCLIVLFG